LFENGGSQAMSWKNGVATPVAGADSYATAINNGGQVTGSQGGQAFRYSGGTASNLSVGGVWSTGMAINNFGAVAGTRMTNTGIFQAFYWSPSGEMVWLTSPGVYGSYAFGINDSGTVVGTLENASGYMIGYVWTARGLQQIGTLGGTMSGAYDVNNRGQVVGYAGLGDGTNAAFLWYAGALLNLNALIDPLAGWQLNEARAINDGGQIVGTGTYQGQRHAFLLNPMVSTPDVFAQSQTAVAHAPEPATLGLVGAALVGLGVLRSKQRA
jgi:probable HAF family extracellular repeat protein